MTYNLRSICKMANRLAKEVKRSDAFKQAWRAAKHGIIEKVVGVTYGGRQGILEQLDQYHNADIQIQIEHERNNPFDVNAVLVTASVVGHDLPMRIGYLDRRNAGIWASLMDQGVWFKTILQGIVGGYNGQNYGMRIKILV